MSQHASCSHPFRSGPATAVFYTVLRSTQQAWTASALDANRSAQTPQTPSRAWQGSRYHDDAYPSVSSPPRTSRPRPLSWPGFSSTQRLGRSCCDLSHAGPPRGGLLFSQEVLFLLLIFPIFLFHRCLLSV
ncbi:hypothetical protein N658DRAFT_342421 [Parathielavia hyrcaniae]|uniref:Uncharacterized protein n=1 Tax=Parathielavia hyrcaniae TaxID=113614 RepID=A0AAN6Q2X3_9PEZI|nr:hypothetical protein N658DRAFT_342421 [Parathielavia hyrcaniae]